jgi:hypothetical protein
MVIAACGHPSKPKEITETRVVTPPPQPAAAAAPAPSQPPSSAERFGAEKAPVSPHGVAHPSSPTLAWSQPEGWKPKQATPMRLASFQAGASPECECYVVALEGDGGGIADNINRWREQMGQPALSPEETAALPTLVVLGKPSPLVEVTGSYTGMTGDAKEHFYLAGVVCLLEGRSVFIKMTGPEKETRPELDRFKAFCQSLR